MSVTVQAPGHGTLGAAQQTASPLPPPAKAEAAPAVLPATSSSFGEGPAGFVAAASSPRRDGRAALAELLTQQADRTLLVLVKAVAIGPWNDWLKSVNPTAAVTPGTTPATTVVNWYDPAWCGCVPGDAGQMRELVQSWKPIQEEQLVLVSAVARYRTQFGQLPATPEALAGHYSSNIIAGWTDRMTGWFRELTDPAAGQGKDGSPIPGWPSGAGTRLGQAVPSGAWHALTEQPIGIVVNTTHHRLAVVSGNVLLRNYAVGLGGNRTPKGHFAVTEKVKNPNGTTDGPFGSRGMTLSDNRYAIHGTNEPDSIGKDESHGCIRMKKEDLEELYDLIPIGTKVAITKGGLPSDTRVPPERFRLPSTRDQTNPRKVYDWLS